MTTLKRFFEWYLGLDPTGEGVGTAWTVHAGPSAGSPLSAPALRTIAVGLAIVIVLLYRRDAARLSRWKRACLTALRLSAAALLLVMLSRLSLRVDQTRLPTVAVLIDVSRSMGVQDTYPDPGQAQTARQLSRSDGKSSPTRLEIARGLLSSRNHEFLSRLRRSHQVKLYSFDEHAHPLATRSQSSEQDTAALLEQLAPEGRETAVGTAVRDVLEEFRGSSLSAILLTDGITTTRDDARLSQAASDAQAAGVPLYTVGIGSDSPARDLELFDLLAPDSVYLGDPATLTFRRRSYGLAGKEVTVRLTTEQSDTPLAQRTLVLGADGVGESTELTFVPEQAGDYLLTVSIAPLPGEFSTSNNRLTHRLIVREDQFRVLYVEGPPRWEYRALKPVLERDHTVNLKTFLQTADLEFADEDRTALRAFPATFDELAEYDVIVWGDVDLDALPPSVPEMLQRYVAETGGGLVFIAGPAHTPLTFAGTPLETLLPVSLIGASDSTEFEQETRGFRLQRTEAGSAWSFMRLAGDAEQDARIWNQFPPEIQWFVATPERKPAAQVLAVHPYAQTAAGRLSLIVLQRYGRGQVLYHGFEQSWTWRKRVEDRYFGRYWSQAVRALARSRSPGSDATAELTTDRRIYEPGDAVRVRLRRTDTGTDFTPATVTVESMAGRRQSATLSARPGYERVQEAVFRDLPLGDYRAFLSDPTGGPTLATTFRIEAAERELRERKIDRLELERAARISHGEFVMFDAAASLPDRIPRGKPVRLTESRPLPLWSRPEIVALLVALLSLEWVLRKRWRLV